MSHESMGDDTGSGRQRKPDSKKTPVRADATQKKQPLPALSEVNAAMYRIPGSKFEPPAIIKRRSRSKARIVVIGSLGVGVGIVDAFDPSFRSRGLAADAEIAYLITDTYLDHLSFRRAWAHPMHLDSILGGNMYTMALQNAVVNKAKDIGLDPSLIYQDRVTDPVTEEINYDLLALLDEIQPDFVVFGLTRLIAKREVLAKWGDRMVVIHPFGWVGDQGYNEELGDGRTMGKDFAGTQYADNIVRSLMTGIIYRATDAVDEFGEPKMEKDEVGMEVEAYEKIKKAVKGVQLVVVQADFGPKGELDAGIVATASDFWPATLLYPTIPEHISPASDTYRRYILENRMHMVRGLAAPTRQLMISQRMRYLMGIDSKKPEGVIDRRLLKKRIPDHKAWLKRRKQKAKQKAKAGGDEKA